MFSYHRLREEGSLGSHQMRPPLASFCLRDLSFPICKPRSLNGEAEQPVFHLCILWLAPSLQNLKEISPDSFPLFWGPVRTDKGGSYLSNLGVFDLVVGVDCESSGQHPTVSFLFPYCVFTFRILLPALDSTKYHNRESHFVT